MNKKIRLIILLVCVILFLFIAPILVAYSMGYRFDFETMKVVATGGIYVRTFPAADQITIDSNISEKPGLFSNYIFVQSLLPKNHTVSIKKAGYYDYFKTLLVQENLATKLENVLLFKKDISFETITATASSPSPFDVKEKFIIKNNNLYYSNIPENSGLTLTQKSTPVLKNLAAFALQNNSILWLGIDGFFYKSDLSNLSASPVKINSTPLKINKKNSYKIIADGKNIFVNNNGSLLFLNTKTNNLDIFATTVKDAKISPDGKNIIYFNNNEAYISTLSVEPAKTSILFKSPETITNLIWLNNDYIIIATTSKIIISEIDYRGNVNAITLPQTITAGGVKIDIKNPEILFNQQTGKLYISTNEVLLLSEKITS